MFTYYKGALSANEGVMQVGQISVFASYVVQILSNLVMISMMLLQLARGKACAERVVEVLDTEIDIVNPENAFVPTEPKGEVEFKNVNFKYDPESHGDNILENISFKAKPGQIVGIVGGTGCGKSSLVNLIPRLYDATQGEVLVDGVDVKKYDLKALREMIGVVLQKMFFSAELLRRIFVGVKRTLLTRKLLRRARRRRQTALLMNSLTDIILILRRAVLIFPAVKSNVFALPVP